MNQPSKIYNPVLTGILMISLATGFTSCDNANNNNQDNRDSKAIAEDHNDAKFDDTKEKDAKFVVEAVHMDMEEIVLSQLAQKHGMSKDVQEMGKMMEEAHVKSLEELRKLAVAKSITVPDSLDNGNQSDFKTLAEKKGNEFDRQYCQMMVEDHKTAVKKYEDAATDAGDIEIKNFANKTLPELRKHLDHAMTCEEKYK